MPYLLILLHQIGYNTIGIQGACGIFIDNRMNKTRIAHMALCASAKVRTRFHCVLIKAKPLVGIWMTHWLHVCILAFDEKESVSAKNVHQWIQRTRQGRACIEPKDHTVFSHHLLNDERFPCTRPHVLMYMRRIPTILGNPRLVPLDRQDIGPRFHLPHQIRVFQPTQVVNE